MRANIPGHGPPRFARDLVTAGVTRCPCHRPPVPPSWSPDAPGPTGEVPPAIRETSASTSLRPPLVTSCSCPVAKSSPVAVSAVTEGSDAGGVGVAPITADGPTPLPLTCVPLVTSAAGTAAGIPPPREDVAGAAEVVAAGTAAGIPPPREDVAAAAEVVATGTAAGIPPPREDVAAAAEVVAAGTAAGIPPPREGVAAAAEVVAAGTAAGIPPPREGVAAAAEVVAAGTAAGIPPPREDVAAVADVAAAPDEDMGGMPPPRGAADAAGVAAGKSPPRVDVAAANGSGAAPGEDAVDGHGLEEVIASLPPGWYLPLESLATVPERNPGQLDAHLIGGLIQGFDVCVAEGVVEVVDVHAG